MRTPVVLLLAGCATTSASSEPALSNAVPRPSTTSNALFVLRRNSLGPITPSTMATPDAIQNLLGSRYIVKQVDNDQVDVYLGDELVFYVIGTDDNALFNVHCPSNKIAIEEHPEWIIGAPLANEAPLDRCECWGPHPMCFGKGDHVAIGFDVPCQSESDFDTPGERKALRGVPIQRAVWNPRPFGDANDSSSSATRNSKSILTPP
jgi:hypothetical protein